MARVLARLIVGCCLIWPPTTHAEGVKRIVSLNLCTDQWLVLLAPEKIAGLSSLARDTTLSYVATEAARFPSIRASAEEVMDLHPDLVLGARFGARTTLALLERAGLRVERLEIPTDFAGIRAVIRATAALLDLSERAGPLIAAMDATLPPPGPPIKALVWEAHGWTSGPGQLMDAVMRAAGMTDAGSGGRVGLEGLLRHPPSLLILSDASAGDSLATDMLRHPAVRGIPVRTIPTSLTICPGPSTAKAVELLARQ
jgi:iron complex transport system substrate-binding protein